MRGRLLEVEMEDPYANLALEEALLRQARLPVLRVWENQMSVVIGRAQLAQFETDLEYCSRNGVAVARRISAGGAVYNGPGNLNWSFIVPRDRGVSGPLMSRDAKGVFSSFAALVVGALARCGVKGEFSPPNSIVAGGGKVCGMAAYLSREGVLCHGTLLVGADLAEVERLTRPSSFTLQRKYPRSRFVPVSNCGVERKKFVEQLARGDGEAYEASLLTDDEKELTSGLLPKYRSDSWNLGDPFSV